MDRGKSGFLRTRSVFPQKLTLVDKKGIEFQQNVVWSWLTTHLKASEWGDANLKYVCNSKRSWGQKNCLKINCPLCPAYFDDKDFLPPLESTPIVNEKKV